MLNENIYWYIRNFNVKVQLHIWRLIFNVDFAEFLETLKKISIHFYILFLLLGHRSWIEFCWNISEWMIFDKKSWLDGKILWQMSGMSQNTYLTDMYRTVSINIKFTHIHIYKFYFLIGNFMLALSWADFYQRDRKMKNFCPYFEGKLAPR